MSPEIDAAKQALRVQVGDLLEREHAVDRDVHGRIPAFTGADAAAARLGKGAGYSDIEVALLQEAGLIGPHTVIVTTVHPLQVVDEGLPETEHDFSVDLVVTPDQVIECGPPRRPSGLYWGHLTEDKIAAIPVLAARAGIKRC